MWFDIIKKEKSIGELVNSYIDIYRKLYESNDYELSRDIRDEMSMEVIRPMFDQRMYDELVEAVSKEDFEQLSLEEFIKEYTEIYLDALNSDEKEYDNERDSVLRFKVPIHKQREFYDKLFENPKFLEARDNFDNYHKRIKEEKENKRKRELEKERRRKNQERLMAQQRARTSDKYTGRKGQRKQNRQTSQKKTRSQRQAASQRKRREQDLKDRERREDEQRRIRRGR